MSEGPGRVQRNGAHPEEWGTSRGMGHILGGHGVTHCCCLCGSLPGRGGGEDAWLGSGHVRISMGAMGGTTLWLLQSRARMRMCV